VTTSNPSTPNSAAPGDADRDAALAARARELLLDSADHLDARTRSRLTQARHAALDQLGNARRPGVPFGGWLAPAGGLAAAVIVALIWSGRPVAPGAVTQVAEVRVQGAGDTFDDLSLIADAESLELAEEIEFYSWLEAEGDFGASGGGVG